MDEVAAIVRAVAPKPVNLLIGTMAGTLPVAELQKAGVRRISLGGALYLRVMADLQRAAGQLAQGDLASAATGLPYASVMGLMDEVAPRHG
jgi:2-methylisocitrate lyase-like PEP mutase family enzyme